MSLAYEEDRIANLRSLLALQWTWPGKKTLFMGCEFGQWTEWNFEAPLDWALLDFSSHQGISLLIRDLNNLYKNHPTWAEVDHVADKFKWIDCNDSEGQTLSFFKFGSYINLRYFDDCCNFSDSHKHKDWGCPHPGDWEVILDTDSPDYSGKGCRRRDQIYSNRTPLQ